MSELEKIQLEHEAAKTFMRRYEAMFHIPMRHIWHNSPSKPDVSCYLNGERLDLEIAHLYGCEEEAKFLLGRTLSAKTQQILELLENTPPTHRMIEALNHVLQSKAEKSYESERVWLVIRNLNPHWQTPEFAQHVHLISSISGYPFEQIWLLSHHDENSECNILRLDELFQGV